MGGTLWITIQHAKDLKNVELFGRQDPYCVVKVGDKAFRTHVARNGGRCPVWNESFEFHCVHHHSVEILIKDSDILRDELIGIATIPLEAVRHKGHDHVSVPVVCGKHGSHHGHLSAVLVWAHSGSPVPSAPATPTHIVPASPAYAVPSAPPMMLPPPPPPMIIAAPMPPPPPAVIIVEEMPYHHHHHGHHHYGHHHHGHHHHHHHHGW
ncbi:hypothetical protein HYH03_007177 [Edaphochlamys debaryana]|uniref:C2 domain-containing protein n=1 Tax=Edaphochlamys debaryana TaxID=47281 RepID=A0A835Y5R2_9CHLO|nr:hypothetical protein HYH03_007177 [Edaphochlamys debaryana]|eukprot:KAG2494661.1 hypothetical protein HYH03_007177 [Edaphochlamys debaryana]